MVQAGQGSKYHVFTVGMHFGERKRRHGRGGRKSSWRKQGDTAEDEASAEAGDPAASSSAVSSSAVSSNLAAGGAAAPARLPAAGAWEGLGESLFIPVVELATKDMMVAASSCPADAGTRFLETLD